MVPQLFFQMRACNETHTSILNCTVINGQPTRRCQKQKQKHKQIHQFEMTPSNEMNPKI
jgi:hypothetical protein